MISRASRIAVIGAGIFGCTIAFRLAQAGVRVTLIDRSPIGENASGKNAGNLNPIFLSPPALVPFALESLRLHRALADELRVVDVRRYPFESAPRVLLAFDESETNQLQTVVGQFAGHAEFSAKMLSGEDVWRCDSRINKSTIGGLLIEGNMSIDARGLMAALIEGAERLGATFLAGDVKGVRTTSQEVNAVVVDHDDVSCDAVCLCTGPWTNEMHEWFGISLLVEPVKGEMLRVKLPGGPLRYDFTHRSISIYRRGDEVWLGTTHCESGFDVETTSEARRELLNGACNIMPALAGAEVIDHTAALRPMTPSGLPIVCKAENWNNVFVANGGGSKGVLLATGVARAMSELMLSGTSDFVVNETIDASFLR